MPAIIRDGAPVEIFPGEPFTDGEGRSYPRDWLALATPAQRAAVPVLDIVDPPAASAGKRLVITGLARQGGQVARTYTLADALPAPVPAEISDRQFAQILAIDGKITQDEALAWAARGDLPDALEDALLQIPEAGGQRFGARMLLSAATMYERAHPLVPTLGALLGYDAAAFDGVWRRGALL